MSTESDNGNGLREMRRRMKATKHRSVVIVLILAATCVSGCFGHGMEAYNRGDYKTAFYEFQLLAELGNAGAQYNLGYMYANGEGVPEDNSQALFWYRKAAEKGHASAQNNLGIMYDNGQGVPEDNSQAVFWYQKAAEQGNPLAQSNLGNMYARGEGVPEDDNLAVFWFRKSAEQESAYGQVSLGIMYANGEGVPEDDRQAVSWFWKAAQQGNPLAQSNLGKMYSKGEGVPKDNHQAVFWLRKAAEQGNADAQFGLGLMYVKGKGVPEDYIQSYAWFNLAAAQGFKNAEQARASMRELLTPAQIAEAQRLSREFEARIAATTVQQQEHGKLEIKGNGSGFVVGLGGEIVTNHHVIADCSKVTVSRAGVPHDVAVRATDAAGDLALLEAPQAVGKAVTFSRSPSASLGEAVTVAGYPLHGLLSKELNVTSGNVSAMAGPFDDARLLQITAPVQPGNSGGPLLDAAGNVIGVVVSKLDAVHVAELTGDIPQNVNFAIKSALVRGFLDIHGIAYRRQASTAKFAPAQLAELARGFTVAVYCWE